jgi:hypothetical protein
MARALKVFRTSIGFHDAYVAAHSQKAALDAWGAESNLFGTGLAEIVTDPKLTKEPLAKPGQIIRVAKGTAAQHLASLPAVSKSPSAKATAERRKPSKPKPRPSRSKLDAAERAIERADKLYDTAVDAIRKREEALRKERQAMNEKQASARADLSQKLSDAQADYDRAMERWRSE